MITEIEVLPKQEEFLRAEEREVLYSGAFGAGKTRALCLKVLMRASRPGARELLCRKTNVSVKRTTLQTLLKPDGNLPPVLPEGTYHHAISEQTIYIQGGGEIIYGGLDDPNKLGSLQLSGAGVDEAIELTEDDWTMLRGRIRVQVSGLSNQLYGATNPGAPFHFLASRFGIVSGDPMDGRRLITTRSSDNVFLDKNYLADLNTFKGVALARYVEGRWVAAEGLVYPEIEKCFVGHQSPPDGAVYGGIDFGYNAPFAAIWGTVYETEEKEVLYVWGERYQNNTPIETHCAALQKEVPSNCFFFADSAQPESIRAMRSLGFTVVRADKSVLAGIDAVNALINSGRIFISENCVNTKKESEVYVYDKNAATERPMKVFDHAMDTLRYLCQGLRKRKILRMEYAA